MQPLEPLVNAALGGLGIPLDDPGDAPLEILEGITLSPDPAVARMQRCIAAAAEKLLAIEARRPPSEQLTFSCADCYGHGWIPVPCNERSSDGKRRCSECSYRHDHLVMRPCWTCDRGIEHLAGIWYRRLCRKDRRGKPSIDESKLPEFDRAMLRLRTSGPRVKVALDRMVAGESSRGPEESPE